MVSPLKIICELSETIINDNIIDIFIIEQYNQQLKRVRESSIKREILCTCVNACKRFPKEKIEFLTIFKKYEWKLLGKKKTEKEKKKMAAYLSHDLCT